MEKEETTRLLQGDRKNGIIGLYEGEVLIKKIPYKNGKVHGIVQLYNKEGVCTEETQYLEGKKNGVSRKYNKKHSLISESIYKNGRLNGKLITYYEKGQVESIAYYTKGKIEGNFKVYDRDGHIVHQTMCENGEISSVNYNTYDRHDRIDEFECEHD